MSNPPPIETNVRITATDNTGRTWQEFSENSKRALGVVDQGMQSLSKRGAELKKTVEELGKSHKAFGSDASSAFGLVSGAVGGFAAKLVATTLSLEGMRRSFLAFADVQRSMERLGASTGLSQRQLEQYSNAFNELARESGRSVKDITAGFSQYMAASGQSAQEAIKNINLVSRAAEVTGTSFESMAQAAGAAIGNLGVKNKKELSEVLDAWVKQVPEGMMGAFAQAVPKLSADLDAIGAKGKNTAIELGAMFVESSRTLGSAGQAASTLEQAFSKMADTGSVLGATMLPTLQSIKDTGGSTVDRVKALIDVMQEYGAFSEELSERAQAKKVLGIDDNFIKTMNTYRVDMGRLEKAVKDGHGAMGEAARRNAEQQRDAQAAANALSASFEMLGIQIGATLHTLGATTILKNISTELKSIADAAKVVNELFKPGGWLNPQVPAEMRAKKLKEGTVGGWKGLGTFSVPSLSDVLTGAGHPYGEEGPTSGDLPPGFWGEGEEARRCAEDGARRHRQQTRRHTRAYR